MGFQDMLAAFARIFGSSKDQPPAPPSAPSKVVTVGATKVLLVDGAVVFVSGLQIDADGAPNAYHPPTAEHPKTGCPPGLDYLGNAGNPEVVISPGNVVRQANWWALVTEDGKRTGKPVVQGPLDPCPGFYISTTALQDPRLPRVDPRRQVDSATVPYVSLPRYARIGDAQTFAAQLDLHLGDLGVSCRVEKLSEVIYADVGPSGKIGEGSIALAKALGTWRGGVNVGHDVRDVATILFPGTAATPGWRREPSEMRTTAFTKFQAWGGTDRLRDVTKGGM